MAGPKIRTDIVDVYVFRAGTQADASSSGTCGVEFLQLRRAQGPLAGTWHPIMGHAHDDETAVRTALRELEEETGFRPAHGLLTLWQLEGVNTYYLARRDCIIMSPCFAAHVGAPLEPVLNEEHDTHRWVRLDQVESHFLWPGQRAAVEEIKRDLLPTLNGGSSRTASLMRIDLGKKEC